MAIEWEPIRVAYVGVFGLSALACFGAIARARARLDDRDIAESITVATETTDRMTNIVRDLATLARFGETVGETTSVELPSVARQAWDSVAADDHRLTIHTGTTVEADRTRLERLFANLFEFSIANGATEVDLSCADDGFVVTDDGEALTEAEIEGAFAYGESIPDVETGMVLPIVRTLAEAHGWTVTIDPAYGDAVRIRVDYSGTDPSTDST